MNATERFTALAALPGSQAAGGVGAGIAAARLVNGIEYARTSAIDEPKLRAAYRRHQSGGATPLVLLGDYPRAPGLLRVLGPQREGVPSGAAIRVDARLDREGGTGQALAGGQGYLAKSAGRPVMVVHPRASAAQLAKLDEAGRLPEGALVTDCAAHGAPYGILAAGSRLRLLAAGPQAVGATTR